MNLNFLKRFKVLIPTHCDLFFRSNIVPQCFNKILNIHEIMRKMTKNFKGFRPIKMGFILEQL